MKRVVSLLVAIASLLLASPTMAMAKGYGGGRSYHSSWGGTGSSYGGSHAYSSSGSSLPSSGSTYHSGTSRYSGGSTYKSGSTGGAYHSGYTSPSYGSRTPLGGLFGNRFRGFGLGHIGSFAGGFILGSMFHPFGLGMGGGYFGGPGYYGGGPGYSPGWSFVGMFVDLLLAVLIIWIIYRILRALARRSKVAFQPAYEGSFGARSAMFGESFGSRSPVFLDLDEQSVVDACCEFVASRQRCTPQDVDVDLTFGRNTTAFGANILIAGRPDRTLRQQELVDAITEFVASRERVNTANVDVDLQFDESLGVLASVRIQ